MTTYSELIIVQAIVIKHSVGSSVQTQKKRKEQGDDQIMKVWRKTFPSDGNNCIRRFKWLQAAAIARPF
jgi:hypothetical protein